MPVAPAEVVLAPAPATDLPIVVSRGASAGIFDDLGDMLARAPYEPIVARPYEPLATRPSTNVLAGLPAPPPVITLDDKQSLPPALLSANSLLALSSSPMTMFSMPSPEDAAIPA